MIPTQKEEGNRSSPSTTPWPRALSFLLQFLVPPSTKKSRRPFFIAILISSFILSHPSPFFCSWLLFFLSIHIENSIQIQPSASPPPQISFFSLPLPIYFAYCWFCIGYTLIPPIFVYFLTNCALVLLSCTWIINFYLPSVISNCCSEKFSGLSSFVCIYWGFALDLKRGGSLSTDFGWFVRE